MQQCPYGNVLAAVQRGRRPTNVTVHNITLRPVRIIKGTSKKAPLPVCGTVPFFSFVCACCQPMTVSAARRY